MTHNLYCIPSREFIP